MDPKIMRRVALYAAAALVGAGCAGSSGDSSGPHEFERDQERCFLNAQTDRGIVDQAAYAACMEARGWELPPPDGD